MTKDEIIQKIIKDIIAKIIKNYSPEKIILYGSYAYGNPTKDSDVDMLIIKNTNKRPIDRRIQVRRIVDLKDCISFSPIVLTPDEVKFLLDIGDPFIKEIMTKGKVLFE